MASLGLVGTGDVAAQVAHDQLHDVVLGHVAAQQQGDGLGLGPAVAAQQALPQEAQVFLAPPVARLGDLDPDVGPAHFHGKGLQIVALAVETTAARQVETAAVPVAGEHSVPHYSAHQRISHVGALVVGRVDFVSLVEQSNAALVAQPHRPGLTWRHGFEWSGVYPLRFLCGHDTSCMGADWG